MGHRLCRGSKGQSERERFFPNSGLAHSGANGTYGGAGTTLVVLNPNHARMIAKRGYGREDVQRRLHELAVTPKRVLNGYASSRQHPAEAGDEVVRAIQSPEKVIVAVAGGEGIYSVVFNCWGGGDHHVLPVTTEIEIGQACELPSFQPAAATA